MHFLGILILILSDLSLGLPAPVDTVILQVQQWGVVGSHQVKDQVLLNGIPLASTSQEVDSLIRSLSASALLPGLISVNKTSVLGNNTLLRSRECILEGSQLHWTDRVFCDGKLCLSLDHTDTWTAQIPDAVALKMLWDQEMQRTRTERVRLQEGCIKLMKELQLSEEKPVSEIHFPPFLIPVLAVMAFAGLITISLLLSKTYGLRHPGGVIGSIIHYPQDIDEMTKEKKPSGYRTL